jgi:hypothetical protein
MKNLDEIGREAPNVQTTELLVLFKWVDLVASVGLL